jgi:flagellar biosynthesis/type III secretory pathway chaperone
MLETVEATLDQHLALCEETYQLLLEENRLLKQTGQPPDQDFLSRKQSLLPRLELSHQAIAKADPTEARYFRQSIGKAQELVMKTLLLDRENEQLLLKCTLTQKPRAIQPVASPARVQKSYGEAAAQSGQSFWWPIVPN